MKISRKQLRRLIFEAYIGQKGADPIKIRTNRVDHRRAVSTTLTPESLDVILDRFITDYDAIKQLPQKPAAPGQRSELYQAMLDRGYNIKVEKFLDLGGRIRTLAMSDDEENRMMALNLGSTLGLFDIDNEGLTGEDLVDSEIMGQQLLNDPKFASIGAVTVREDELADIDANYLTHLISSDNPKERSLGTSLLSGALNNNNFIKQFMRKIDTAFENALPHIKESILDEIHYQVYAYGNDYQSKDPFEGEDINEFIADTHHAIMGTLGSFTGFQEIDAVFDTGLNGTDELGNYFDVSTLKSIKRAIEELIEAGLLEKIPRTNSFKMTKEVYKKRKNQQSGRKEDIYKQQGLRLEPDHQDYTSNPNVPVVTEEIIRQMIKEAIKRA